MQVGGWILLTWGKMNYPLESRPDALSQQITGRFTTQVETTKIYMHHEFKDVRINRSQM